MGRGAAASEAGAEAKNAAEGIKLMPLYQPGPIAAMPDALPSPLRAITWVVVIWLLLGQIVYRRLRRKGKKISVAVRASLIYSLALVGLGIIARLADDGLRRLGW